VTASEACNAEGLTGALVPARPEFGPALERLSCGEITILPIRVCEDEEGRITARLGGPFMPEWTRGGDNSDPEPLTDKIMHAVAARLPSEVPGAYGARA
jgi:hypothetical protein